MQIGQIIRSLREEKGWPQEKLAFEAGLETSHLSRIERGERRLAIEALDSLAAALGTSPAAIYAIREGLELQSDSGTPAHELRADYTPEAVELRKIFRELSAPDRQLLIDFGLMLKKRS